VHCYVETTGRDLSEETFEELRILFQHKTLGRTLWPLKYRCFRSAMAYVFKIGEYWYLSFVL